MRGALRLLPAAALQAACAALAALAPVAGNAQTDTFRMAAQAEARRTCSDDHSAKVLRLWLEALPGDASLAIADPTVRRAAMASRVADMDLLRAAGKRIFLYDPGVRRRINHTRLEKELAELRREFRTDQFPRSLNEALAGNDRNAALYIRAVQLSIAPAEQDCSRIFMNYFRAQDERVEFMRTERVAFGPNPFLLQKNPGTEDYGPEFSAPAEGCVRRPSGSDFFKIVNGRQAGRFSPLGFPEVVRLDMANAAGRWTCSGVLLDADWVLTAGHCVDDGVRQADVQRTIVRVNGRIAQRTAQASVATRSTVTAPFHVLDGYREALARNAPHHERGAVDIALLKLSTPLPVRSPPLADTPALPVTILGTLAGYGTSTAPVLPNRPDPALEVGWLNVQVLPTLIHWMADHAPGAPGPDSNASCPGDSGAPVFATVGNSGPTPESPAVGCFSERRQLVGLVSFGTSIQGTSCLASSQGAGPRLLPHLPWICRTANLFCPKPPGS